ncbi:MAG: FAD-dependent oxidoreductase [Rhodospirillaceae bacterium]|nr:FAD-dependent oxidoreductase [Rhodospirillaceae bacterium]
MRRRIDTDLCVIGGGSAGLSVAAGAVQMGASTVLIERGAMGGDCLNTGCVPSKALLAAARTAETMRRAGRFGLPTVDPQIDFARVHDHVHGVIAAIAPIDSQERFEGLGVTVLRETAIFTSPDTLLAGDVEVRARRFVIATGSAPAVPPLPGLDRVPFLTNETIFGLSAAPGHLVVLGGGPIGVEMAQAHRRLGCRVTVVERAKLLPKDDPDLVDVVRRTLTADGVEILEGVRATAVAPDGDGVVLDAERGGETIRIAGSHLLVAVGRRAMVDGLGLDQAGVAHTPAGITVDRRLRTSNRRIYAIGDVTGGPQFTHVASHHASVVLRSILFRLPAKVNDRALPWVTYCEPELANVGLTEAAARARYGDFVQVAEWSFADNDRAQAEHATDGRIKVVATKRGRVLGAGIVGPHAGELILPWGLAIARGIRLSTLVGLIVPYPTLSEVSKRAAGAFYAAKLFSERTRKVVRFLARFG